MAVSYGKKFEGKFKSDWMKTFPHSFIYRLPDQQSMYHATSSNPCDFMCFNEGIFFLLECKSIRGNTFPLVNLRQYEKLLLEKLRKVRGMRVGVVIWFIDHSRVCYCPIKEIAKMKDHKKKSINVKDLSENTYNIIELPSRLRRTFLDTDYSKLMKLDDEERVIE